MRYLITGLTGFAGPHLANLLLSQGHEVAGLIRGSNGREDDIRDVVPDEHFQKIRWIYGDLKDIDALDKAFAGSRFDGVFHLAAQSHPPTSFTHPIGTFADNVMGSVTLVEVMRRHQPECKFMFCSTSEVYGDTGKDVGVLHETNRCSQVIRTATPKRPWISSSRSVARISS